VLREGMSRVARATAAGSDEADVMKAQRWCSRMAQHRDTPKECRSGTFLALAAALLTINCRGELAELAQYAPSTPTSSIQLFFLRLFVPPTPFSSNFFV
jgi:hypothetical protein